MARRRRNLDQDNQGVQMSAMIDVVFLLLIFFVYTQKDEILEAHMNVNMPSPKPPERTCPPPGPMLELEVHPGQVLLQGVPRSQEKLADTLKYLADLDSDVTVLVKTSVMTRTRELVEVLDLCKGVGLTRLNVVRLK